MTDPLRPHVALASSRIFDVAPLPEGAALPGGGYALLTETGIELWDAALAHRGSIAAAERTHGSLVVLPDGRCLVYGSSPSRLYEGRAGGSLAQVEGCGLVRSVAVTERGFLAIGTDGVVVDAGGARSVVAPAKGFEHGGAAWRGGAAVAGFEGLVILGADGAITARSAEKLWRRPVALADAIAAPGHDSIVVFDGAAQVLARIPREVSGDAVTAFGGGLLVRVYDEGAGMTEVSYWELAGGAAVERWSAVYEELIMAPLVAGAWIALVSAGSGVRLLDGGGAEVAHVPTAGIGLRAAPFAGGVALTARDTPDVLWWRPGEGLARLPHDVWPYALVGVPAGLASSEDNVLYVWRTDVQGPEVAAAASDVPLDTPIVIGGTAVRITAAGRFALRGQTLSGRAWGVRRGATYRVLTARDEAARIVERLVQRAFDGPLPAVPTDAPIFEAAVRLAQLPLAETAALHGRALFAASTLDPALAARAAWARASFFEELGAALGVSGRALLAAVKARRLKLEPPRPVAGYEYLGSFTSGGELTVSDPCYAGRKAGAGTAAISLSLKVAAHAGVWHVFVRSGAGADRERTAELVAIHDDGFELYATDPIGSIGVDSGTAGIFDKQCPRRDPDAPLEEGPFAALGAIASTGYGDGMYPVYAGRLKGRVAKLRLAFLGDGPEVDRTVTKSAAATKPYSASARFALGDTITHPKFGEGSVIRVGSDGKIDVRFADATRTLVHGKK